MTPHEVNIVHIAEPSVVLTLAHYHALQAQARAVGTLITALKTAMRGMMEVQATAQHASPVARQLHLQRLIQEAAAAVAQTLGEED